jgi:hypothetical protein
VLGRLAIPPIKNAGTQNFKSLQDIAEALIELNILEED